MGRIAGIPALLAVLALHTPAGIAGGEVPSWARDAIWYQIFPERFRNGDTTNDPTLEDIRGSWPHDPPAAWERSRWTADWYALQPWEQTGKGFYVEVQRRRYGGDLQGVIDKLDYLRDLGVTALYFNPVFEAPSLHKYDAAMYHHIDNNFGPDPAGDAERWAQEKPDDPSTWTWTSADLLFLRLIAEAHSRQIKVVLDGVFNHTGLTFWAFEDLRRNGRSSPYTEWYTVTSYDNPATPEDEFEYRGWMGVKELPEIREDRNGLVKGPKEHVRAIVKRWMDPDGDGDPSDGIDGWRLDVAEMVGLPFWREFRKWVRDINPNAYIVGEVWWEDWSSGRMFNAEPWLKGDVFDAVMNYRVARAMNSFFREGTRRISGRQFLDDLKAIRSDYRPEATAVLMNTLGSHDTDRLASQILNKDSRYDFRVGLPDNPEYNIAKPGPRERAIQRLMVLFQMTYVGAPHIYYGDEAGMWGGDDPDCRKPMMWPELSFDPEATHPLGKARTPDPVGFDTEMHGWYARMCRMRKEIGALRGDGVFVLSADSSHAFAIQRSSDEGRAIVAVNASDSETLLSIAVAPTDASAEWRSAMSGATFRPDRKGFMTVALAALSGDVLIPVEP